MFPRVVVATCCAHSLHGVGSTSYVCSMSLVVVYLCSVVANSLVEQLRLTQSYLQHVCTSVQRVLLLQLLVRARLSATHALPRAVAPHCVAQFVMQLLLPLLLLLLPAHQPHRPAYTRVHSQTRSKRNNRVACKARASAGHSVCRRGRLALRVRRRPARSLAFASFVSV